MTTEQESGAIDRDCPYCPGVLEDMEEREHVYQCSNLGDCPATFVAVLSPGGGSA